MYLSRPMIHHHHHHQDITGDPKLCPISWAMVTWDTAGGTCLPVITTIIKVVNVILTVVHQGDDAGVQALEAATIVLQRRGGQFQEMSKKMCELS